MSRVSALPMLTIKKPQASFKKASGLVFSVVITFIGVMTVLMLGMTLGPRLGFYQTYSVLSGSMEPTLGVGSMIVLEKVQPQDLRVGDIISVQVPDLGNKLVTHRIVELHNTSAGVVFQTKGDANGQKDSWTVTAKGPTAGWRYLFGIPWVGYLLAWMQTPFFRLLLVGIPSLVIAFIFLWDIWKPVASTAVPAPAPALAPVVEPDLLPAPIAVRVLAAAPNPVFASPGVPAVVREKPGLVTRIALG